MCKLVAIFENTLRQLQGDVSGLDEFLTEKRLDEKIQKALSYRASFDFGKIQDVSHLSSQYFGSTSVIDPTNIDNISNGYSEDFPGNQEPTCTENYITDYQD